MNTRAFAIPLTLLAAIAVTISVHAVEVWPGDRQDRANQVQLETLGFSSPALQQPGVRQDDVEYKVVFGAQKCTIVVRRSTFNRNDWVLPINEQQSLGLSGPDSLKSYRNALGFNACFSV